MRRTDAMTEAIVEFCRDIPLGCSLDPKRDKPIYTLVKVDEWPSKLHYEFRSQDSALCIELHIESGKYAFLGETFRQCSEELGTINGWKVEFHEQREGRHWKKWPSISIQLPPDATGEAAAKVMRQLITKTRVQVSRALDSSHCLRA